MIKKIIAIASVLLVGLGCWISYYFSDKEVIKRQFIRIASELSKDGQETPVQLSLRMREVKSMLTDSCRVMIPERSYDNVMEHDLIIRYLTYHRNSNEFIAVTFEDQDIAIPAKRRAVVQYIIKLKRKPVGQSEDFDVVTWSNSSPGYIVATRDEAWSPPAIYWR